MNTEIEQHVGSLSLEFVEGLLADYLRNPDSVPPDWRSYFDDMTRGNGAAANGGAHVAPVETHANGNGSGNGHNHAVTQIGPSFRPASLFGRPRVDGTSPTATVATITAAPRVSAPPPNASAPSPAIPATAAAAAAAPKIGTWPCCKIVSIN